MRWLAVALLCLCSTAFGQNLPIPGPGQTHVGNPTVTFTANASTYGGVPAGYSLRELCYTNGAYGLQVRVTVKAGSGGGSLAVNHVSIGVGTGSGANTVSTPVELLFGGASGFTLPANGTATSDWANLYFGQFSMVVVVFDIGAGGPGTYTTVGGSNGRVYYAAAATYNVATPGAASGNDAITDLIQTIEVR